MVPVINPASTSATFHAIGLLPKCHTDARRLTYARTVPNIRPNGASIRPNGAYIHPNGASIRPNAHVHIHPVHKMDPNNVNEKKRNLNVYGEENNFANPQTSTSPSQIPTQPFFYTSVIPQYPFSPQPFGQTMNYPNMMQHMHDFNYNSKRSMKRKKNNHHFNKHQHNEISHLKEAMVDPWKPLYVKHPHIKFI
ncbi:hypothetical protein POVWA1_001480 [Plasmodium ovale wallikeri]|uniref:Uncharacterized protein n=1 Tax=Plasmodium ovale wallikeri TaxID=864142 RepID=A0A1A8YG16_PLAOA|nr:hypothetical protein POVWA1_001480 [Plasmodium ovale wallikeri]